MPGAGLAERRDSLLAMLTLFGLQPPDGCADRHRTTHIDAII